MSKLRRLRAPGHAAGRARADAAGAPVTWRWRREDWELYVELQLFLMRTRATRVWLRPDLFARVRRYTWDPNAPRLVGTVVFERSEFHT
jgi:hypothetical protein